MAIFSAPSKITRPQRPSGIKRMSCPVKKVGRKVNKNSASATPAKAAQVISTFWNTGPVCSSSHLSSLLSGSASSTPSIATSAACIRYL